MTPAMGISFCGFFAAAAAEGLRLGLHLAGGGGVDYLHVAEFFAVLVQRVAGDEEAEDFFFVLQAGVLVPLGYAGERVFGGGGSVGPRSASKIPKRPCWPAAASFWDFWARSMALSRAAKSCARLPKASIAPALLRDFEDALVQEAEVDFFAELVEANEALLPFCLERGACGDDGVDGVVADVLDGGEAEADACRRWG